MLISIEKYQNHNHEYHFGKDIIVGLKYLGVCATFLAFVRV
jgi:hypothetical protein